MTVSRGRTGAGGVMNRPPAPVHRTHDTRKRDPMPYDRIYTLSEVGRILYESELRPRPTTGMPGHALGQHGDLRDDIMDKRYRPVILLAATLEESRSMSPEDGVGTPIAPHKLEPSDGKFLSRKDQIMAVHEALNSPGGQQVLRKL